VVVYYLERGTGEKVVQKVLAVVDGATLYFVGWWPDC